MELRRMVENDSFLVAKLHREGITTGFLSTLGIVFLQRLYRAIDREKGGCVFVAADDGNFCGFIAGTIDIHSTFRKVLIKNCLVLGVAIIQYMFSAKNLIKMAETILYGFRSDGGKSEDRQCRAELFSIVVANAARGKGVGKCMVEKLEQYFKEKGIRQYKVVTASNNQGANKFYRKCNFILKSSFAHHGNVLNLYKKDIS